MLLCDRPKIYDIDLIGLAVALGICLGLWYGVIQPLAAKTSESVSQQQGKIAEKKQSVEELEHLRRLNEQRQKLAAELSRTRDILRENTGTPSLIRTIEGAAERWELTIEEVIPGQTRQTPHYTINEMSLDLSGAFPGLVGFIEELSQDIPYVCISTMTADSRQGNPAANMNAQCRFHLDLDIFSP